MRLSIALLPAFALPLVMSAAGAHTALRSAVPENGSTVTESPQELVLEFSGPVRLTAVSLANAAGKKVETGAVPAETEQRFALPVKTALTAGDYVVTWRAVGADTHVVSGEVKFKVATAATSRVSANSTAPQSAAARQDAAPEQPSPTGETAPR